MSKEFLLFLLGLLKLYGIFMIIAVVSGGIYGFFERRSKRKDKYSDKL